jgi:hypothetical protein
MNIFDSISNRKKKIEDLTQGRKFGWKRDLHDPRDIKYKVSPPSAPRILPPLVDLRPFCPPIYDQADIGSCTAQALASAFQFEQMKQGIKNFIPSRLFIYFNERVIENTVNEDAGAMIRDGIKTLANEGVCPETMWKYQTWKFTKKPCPECYTTALNNQVIQYERIAEHTLQGVKEALADGYPVVFGFTIYDSMMTDEVASSGHVPIPTANDKPVGGHAILGCGYSDENQALIVKNSWGCYDEKTEVLTKNGFVYFKDIIGDEEFATLNNEGCLEYQKSIDKTSTKYIGKMKQFKSSKIDLLVTPNHNMYVKTNRCKKKFELMEASKINTKRFSIKRDCDWHGNYKEKMIIEGYQHNVNATKIIKIDDMELPMNDYLELLGYFLSEGNTSISKCAGGGNEYYVSISQKKIENRKIMKEFFKRLPFNVHEDKNGFSIANKQLCLHFQKFGLCDKKYIDKSILELDKIQLKILYDALMLGDGSITKSKNSYNVTYYTTSKQLSDDFQELCLKLGYSSSIYLDDRVGTKSSDGYDYNYIGYQIRIQNSFSLKKTKFHTVQNNLDDIDYDGNIYCVTVPNHILFIRRNNKTCWCGNSNWGLGGYFYLPYWYITTPDASADFWVIKLVEEDLINK